MPARRARGITGGSSARGWGVWQSFFGRRHFIGRDSSKVSVRPCVRAVARLVRAVEIVRALIRSSSRRSRSSRSQVEAWLTQIALIISTDTEDADGESRAARHHRFTCRAVRGCRRPERHLRGRGTARRTDYAPRIVQKPPYSPYERVQQDGRRIYGRSLRRVLRRSTRRFGRGGGECGILLSHDRRRKKYFRPSRLRKHPAEGAICVCTF